MIGRAFAIVLVQEPPRTTEICKSYGQRRGGMWQTHLMENSGYQGHSKKRQVLWEWNKVALYSPVTFLWSFAFRRSRPCRSRPRPLPWKLRSPSLASDCSVHCLLRARVFRGTFSWWLQISLQRHQCLSDEGMFFFNKGYHEIWWHVFHLMQQTAHIQCRWRHNRHSKTPLCSCCMWEYNSQRVDQESCGKCCK